MSDDGKKKKDSRDKQRHKRLSKASFASLGHFVFEPGGKIEEMRRSMRDSDAP